MNSYAFRAFLLLPAAVLMSDGNSTRANGSALERGIQLKRVAAISGEAARLLPSYAVVTQDPSGRLLATTRRRDQLLALDAEGRLLSRIGGAGASAFRKAGNPVVDSAGVIYVYDDETGVLSVISPDLELKEQRPMPYRPSLALPDGQFIVAEQIRTPELVGFPIHLMDARGRVVKSFGADTAQYRADLHLITDRIAAPARNGGIWVAARGRYVVERWDPLSGRSLQRFAIQSSWFRESLRPVSDETQRPTALLQALWQDEQALWVLLRDADSAWKPPAKPNVERPFDLQVYNATYDWIIEAIDTKSGTVIASTRLDTAHLARSPSSLLVSQSRDDAGLNFSVWRANLVEGRRK